MAPPGVKLLFEGTDIEFSSTAAHGRFDQYDTSEFHNYVLVSLGTTNEVNVNGRMIYFGHNVYTKFDGRNFFYCKFLNLRHSAFRELDLKYLI